MSKSHSASAILKFTPLAEARSLFHWPPWVGFDHPAIVLSHQGHSLGSCRFPGSIVAMSSLLELARMKKPQPSAAASLLDLVSSTKPRASSSDSDESESGQGTSGSSSDATSSSEESLSENSELARLRRKARTEKARATYMKNVTERKTRSWKRISCSQIVTQPLNFWRMLPHTAKMKSQKQAAVKLTPWQERGCCGPGLHLSMLPSPHSCILGILSGMSSTFVSLTIPICDWQCQRQTDGAWEALAGWLPSWTTFKHWFFAMGSQMTLRTKINCVHSLCTLQWFH